VNGSSNSQNYSIISLSLSFSLLLKTIPIRLLLLTVAIVLICVSLCGKFNIILWAKIVMAFANLFLIIGFILVPIGFAWLDDPCEQKGKNEEKNQSKYVPFQMSFSSFSLSLFFY
jgi:hypothetical protein